MKEPFNDKKTGMLQWVTQIYKIPILDIISNDFLTGILNIEIVYLHNEMY